MLRLSVFHFHSMLICLIVTPPDQVDLRKIYGEHFKALLELKEIYDPKNVFNLSVPRL